MLLTIFALIVGLAIGRARGGRWTGVLATRINGKPFLIAAIGATLILNLLTPSFPMFWLAISFIGYIGFAASNLTLTGMIVVLIGLVLNLVPVLANWSVPVSEVALQSVGVVDDSGTAVIDGPRESTATARTFSFLGDVIPVPIFDKVVSIGDLIALVAVADVAAHAMFKGRRETEEAEGPEEVDEHDDDLVIDLREGVDTPRVDRRGPAHARASGLKLIAPMPKVRRPAHAAPESEPERFIPPPGPDARPLFAAPPRTLEPSEGLGGEDELDSEEPLDLTDRRPIIDLTVSPTDDQLAEFLRRRAEADRRLAEAPLPATRPRRGLTRGRRRRSTSSTVR